MNAGLVGAIGGLVAVAAGAFGAHGLEGRIDGKALETWDLAARYQMVHALALLIVAGRERAAPSPSLRVAAWAFVAGIAIFSGSLYLLAVTGVTALGAITPLGGAALLVGWGALAVAYRRRGG